MGVNPQYHSDHLGTEQVEAIHPTADFRPKRLRFPEVARGSVIRLFVAAFVAAVVQVVAAVIHRCRKARLDMEAAGAVVRVAPATE